MVARAIGHFQKALELRPDFLTARRALGLAFEKAGRRDDALFQASLAISSAPNDAETLWAMGVVLRGAGKPGEAQRYFQKALAAEPKYPDALVGLAMAQADQEKFAEAAKNLEVALSLDPWSAEAPLRAGQCVHEAKRIQRGGGSTVRRRLRYARTTLQRGMAWGWPAPSWAICRDRSSALTRCCGCWPALHAPNFARRSLCRPAKSEATKLGTVHDTGSSPLRCLAAGQAHRPPR